MKLNLTQKIIKEHLVSGDLTPGTPISIRIDRTLTQDSTGTMAYLQLEALNIDKVKTEFSIAYIDHNMLQSSFENADDHAYIQSVALKHGVYVSKPGNGICHQVNLERFSVPGKTLTGSDSHTPTCGAAGMLAIGVGGLDVALNMGGAPLNLIMPEVINVELINKLPYYATAKDVILELLKRLSVKGGVNKVFEYTGEGVKSLSVPGRATITNMGAELGATASIFAADEVTREFFVSQGREADFVKVCADEGANYDGHIVIDLSKIVPLAACPHSPDNIKPVSELNGMKIDQICIGSCTDSSLETMLTVAAILKGKSIAPDVSLTINPGSRQVLAMLSSCGALADIINSGARIMECACGPCIGVGQAPGTNAVSLRTFNRNFFARSGTKSANVYLVSPLTAAYSAVRGTFSNPQDFAPLPKIAVPRMFDINDNLILNPSDFKDITVKRGPNIKPFPTGGALEDNLSGDVLIVCPDNITTDHIMPSDSRLLPYRSNIPYLSDYCLNTVDEGFAARAKASGGGFIVAGANYGQGSSREHAALVPKYLGIKAVLALSFARIHKDNLINNGILPLIIKNSQDLFLLTVGARLSLSDVLSGVKKGGISVKIEGTAHIIETVIEASPHQKSMLLAGGALNMIQHKEKG